MERARSDGLPAAGLAALVNSFANLEYLKRVMRMKPNPKPIEVNPAGANKALIDYRKLVRRPAAQIIDVAEPKPPGPRTVMTSSDYYKAQAGQQAPIVAKPEENTATGSGAVKPPEPQEPNVQKPQ